MAKDDKKDKDNDKKDNNDKKDKDKDNKSETTTVAAAVTDEEEDEKKKKDKDKKNKTGGTSKDTTSKKLQDDKDKGQKKAKGTNYQQAQQKANDKASLNKAKDKNADGTISFGAGGDKYRKATVGATDAAGNTQITRKSGEVITVDSKGRPLATNKQGEVKTDKDTGKQVTQKAQEKAKAKEAKSDVSQQMEAGTALTGLLNAASLAKSGRKADNQGVSSRYGKRADDPKQGKGAVYAYSNVNDDGSLKTDKKGNIASKSSIGYGTGAGGTSGGGKSSGGGGDGKKKDPKGIKPGTLVTPNTATTGMSGTGYGTDQVTLDFD